MHSGTNKYAKELLIRALNDDSSEVRAEAATIAGKTLAPEEIINELCGLLKDKDNQVRINTALALMKIEEISSINSLSEAISAEEDGQVKTVLEVALNQLIALK